MKNPTDPIIEELHETRRKIAQRFNFDVRRISEDAKRRQAQEARPVWEPNSANQTIDPSGEAGHVDSGESSVATGSS